MEDRPEKPARDTPHHVPSFDPRLTLRPQTFRLAALNDTDNERFEIKFFENVLATDPCNEEALMLLGNVYTREGDYRRGLDLDKRLVRLRPEDPTAFYNLACSYALLHRTGEAYASLEKAVSLGYRNLSHLLKDPDLEHLRQDSNFRPFVARLLGRKPSDS